MFISLAHVFLWIIAIILLYLVLFRLIPRMVLTFLGGAILLTFVILAFSNPGDHLVADVWQVLSLPLSIIGLPIILIGVGLLQIKKDKITDSGKYLFIIAFCELYIFSTTMLGYYLAQVAEQAVITLETERRQYCAPNCYFPSPDQETAPVIVLLGTGTTVLTARENFSDKSPIPRLEVQLGETSDRILATADLYQQQLTLNNNPVVIVSAAPRKQFRYEVEEKEKSDTTEDLEKRIANEAQDIKNILIQLNIPENRIIIESKGASLHDSAVKVQEILKEQQLTDQKIMLITSAVNMNLARRTFEHLGMKIIPKPTDFISISPQSSLKRNVQVSDFVPSVRGLMINHRIVQEYLTSIYYLLRGWISPKVF